MVSKYKRRDIRYGIWKGNIQEERSLSKRRGIYQKAGRLVGRGQKDE